MKTLFQVIKELRCSNYYIIKQRPFRMSSFLLTGRCSPPRILCACAARLRPRINVGSQNQPIGTRKLDRILQWLAVSLRPHVGRACAENMTGGGLARPGSRLRRKYDGEGHRPVPGRACAENTKGEGKDDVTPINLRERVEFSEAKRKLIDTFLKS